MALDTTVRARVDSQLKKDVEEILSKIGLTTSQAINIYLNRIKIENGIPFELKIPNDETLEAIKEAELGINMEPVSINEMIEEYKSEYDSIN